MQKSPQQLKAGRGAIGAEALHVGPLSPVALLHFLPASCCRPLHLSYVIEHVAECADGLFRFPLPCMHQCSMQGQRLCQVKRLCLCQVKSLCHVTVRCRLFFAPAFFAKALPRRMSCAQILQELLRLLGCGSLSGEEPHDQKLVREFKACVKSTRR